MKPLARPRAGGLWLFAVCVALYLGLLGPWLISASSTLAVFFGVAIFVALLAWAWRLFAQPNHTTDNKE